MGKVEEKEEEEEGRKRTYGMFYTIPLLATIIDKSPDNDHQVITIGAREISRC